MVEMWNRRWKSTPTSVTRPCCRIVYRYMWESCWRINSLWTHRTVMLKDRLAYFLITAFRLLSNLLWRSKFCPFSYSCVHTAFPPHCKGGCWQPRMAHFLPGLQQEWELSPKQAPPLHPRGSLGPGPAPHRLGCGTDTCTGLWWPKSAPGAENGPTCLHAWCPDGCGLSTIKVCWRIRMNVWYLLHCL